MQRLSARNSRVAEIRALARQRRARAESGRFVVEGPKLISEALLAGAVDGAPYRVDAVFVDAADGWTTDNNVAAINDAMELGVEIFELEAGLIDRIGASKSPQPIVAVVEGEAASFSALPENCQLVLAAVDINDPGNMGTLIRSAVAAGADAIVSLGQSVDVFSPKTVRSSAGALFHVPVIADKDAHHGLDQLGAHGLIRLGMAGQERQSLIETDLTRPVAVVVGSEAHGLPSTLSTRIDEWVSIPMAGPTESLNVAMAATIVVYEVLRQRLSN